MTSKSELQAETNCIKQDFICSSSQPPNFFLMVPPPPLSEQILSQMVADGSSKFISSVLLSTENGLYSDNCTMCEWSHNYGSFSADKHSDILSKEWIFVLTIVAIFSALIGAIFMVAVFRCKRFGHGNVSGSCHLSCKNSTHSASIYRHQRKKRTSQPLNLPNSLTDPSSGWRLRFWKRSTSQEQHLRSPSLATVDGSDLSCFEHPYSLPSISVASVFKRNTVSTTCDHNYTELYTYTNSGDVVSASNSTIDNYAAYTTVTSVVSSRVCDTFRDNSAWRLRPIHSLPDHPCQLMFSTVTSKNAFVHPRSIVSNIDRRAPAVTKSFRTHTCSDQKCSTCVNVRLISSLSCAENSNVAKQVVYPLLTAPESGESNNSNQSSSAYYSDLSAPEFFARNFQTTNSTANTLGLLDMNLHASKIQSNFDYKTNLANRLSNRHSVKSQNKKRPIVHSKTLLSDRIHTPIANIKFDNKRMDRDPSLPNVLLHSDQSSTNHKGKTRCWPTNHPTSQNTILSSVHNDSNNTNNCSPSPSMYKHTLHHSQYV